MIGEGSIINNRFRLDRLLGRGGFAQVFLATDAVLGRQVAIKILNPAQEGAEGFDFLGRFQTEARAVAALEHPNLLGIYDFGEVEGTAYLVMPYIDGGNLQDRIAGGHILPLRQVANYLGQTAAGLDYAHRRGIVHRDIKPQNLLIRAEDNRLLIADFGVAKVMQGNSASTQTAAIGTVSYMAPEQLSGRAAPSIDIYALGCVLFQLLTGRVPYAGPATQVMLAHMNSPIPSVQERSDGRLPAAFQPLFNRALAKTPEDRFATAEELARAFEGLLATISAPIQPPPVAQSSAPTQIGGATPGPRSNPPASLPAVPSTPPVQPTPPVVTPSASPQPAPGPVISPMLQRPATPSPVAQSPATPPDSAASRRTWLMLAGIGALVVIVIIAIALLINLIRPQSNTTPIPTARPSPVAATLTTGVTGLSTTPTAPAATSPSTAAPASAPAQPTRSPTAGASVAQSSAGPPSAAPSPAASPTATGSRAPSAAPSVAPAAVDPGPVLVGHTDHARAVAWPQGGNRLISGGSDGTVRIWSVDGALLNTFSGKTFAVTSVVLSPDGSMLAVGSDDGKVHLWNIDGTEVQVFSGHTKPVTSVAWAPGGKRLVSGSQDGTVRLWSVGQQDGKVLTGHTDVVLNVAWSSTNLIASASWDKTIRLWNADGTPVKTLEGTNDQVWAVAWSPDGQLLASGSLNGQVRLWHADGTLVATLTGHTKEVSSLAWSPGGAILASGSFDGTIRLWTSTGQSLGVITGHTDAVTAVAWGPQSGQLASASWDKTVRIWSVRR